MTGASDLSMGFTRSTRCTWIDAAEAVRAERVFTDGDLEAILGHLAKVDLLHPPSAVVKPLDAAVGGWDIDSELLIKFLQWWQEYLAKPYTLHLVNTIGIRVQFVWAYESWNGLILLDESKYVDDGVTATMIADGRCYDMRQYAVSLWDEDDNELFRTPTLTVDYVNSVEKKNGTFQLCEDTLEFGV